MCGRHSLSEQPSPFKICPPKNRAFRKSSSRVSGHSNTYLGSEFYVTNYTFHPCRMFKFLAGVFQGLVLSDLLNALFKSLTKSISESFLPSRLLIYFILLSRTFLSSNLLFFSTFYTFISFLVSLPYRYYSSPFQALFISPTVLTGTNCTYSSERVQTEIRKVKRRPYQKTPLNMILKKPISFSPSPLSRRSTLILIWNLFPRLPSNLFPSGFTTKFSGYSLTSPPELHV